MPQKPVTYFTTPNAYETPPPRKEYPFARLSYAELTVCAPLIPLTWNGDFPKTEHDQQHVCYEMEDIRYMDTGGPFYFDSQDDFNSTQDGVCFMPILGLEVDNQVEGLIIRPAKRPHPRPWWVSEPFDESQACFMRIGMAIIDGEEAFASVKTMATREIVLL